MFSFYFCYFTVCHIALECNLHVFTRAGTVSYKIRQWGPKFCDAVMNALHPLFHLSPLIIHEAHHPQYSSVNKSNRTPFVSVLWRAKSCFFFCYSRFFIAARFKNVSITTKEQLPSRSILLLSVCWGTSNDCGMFRSDSLTSSFRLNVESVTRNSSNRGARLTITASPLTERACE